MYWLSLDVLAGNLPAPQSSLWFGFIVARRLSAASVFASGYQLCLKMVSQLPQRFRCIFPLSVPVNFSSIVLGESSKTVHSSEIPDKVRYLCVRA